MTAKILTIILASFIFLLVIELIREEKLTFKYASGWLLFSLLALLGAIFDQVLFKTAHFLGFELPSNFIFFALLSVLVFLSLLITIFLCQQNSRNDTMAQKIGMIEFKMKELDKKIAQLNKGHVHE